MKMALHIGYAGASMDTTLRLVQLADQLGFESVWTAESYGADAVTVLAYLAGQTTQIKLGSGIAQMAGRTPANTAMTLDAISKGRLILGLGVSNPQVVEGWHGMPFDSPIGRTREYVEIVRRILARERVNFDGAHYQIPYQGARSTGLGKPLKSILHPVRDTVPIYLAAIGPKNIALTAEIADGWLPAFYSPEREHVFAEDLKRGRDAGGRRSGKPMIAASVNVALGDDLAACRDKIRPGLALYIGGMGRGARTSTTGWLCGTASKRRPATSRICTWKAGRTRQPRPSPTNSLTRSRWWDRLGGSRSAWPHGSGHGWIRSSYEPLTTT